MNLKLLFIFLTSAFVTVSCGVGGSSAPATGDSSTSLTTPYDAGAGYGAGEDSCDGITSSGNPYPCCTNTKPQYGNGNCTWYAAYRAATAWGDGFYDLGSLGNAKNWWTSIQNKQNSSADRTAFVHQLGRSLNTDGSNLPVIGSVAIRTIGSFGHVAWVVGVDTSVTPATVTVMEQNCIHDGDKLLSPSFPEAMSNSLRSKTYSASHFQHYITYGVQATGNPPSLNLENSSGASILEATDYQLTFKANDQDGDLQKIEVNWNDGSTVSSKAATDNQVLNFVKTFTTTGAYSWSATAYDRTGKRSPMRTGQFTVKPVVTGTAPTLSMQSNSGAFIAQGEKYTVNFNAADVDGNLSSVIFIWGDGTNPVTQTANNTGQYYFEKYFNTPQSTAWSAYSQDAQGLRSPTIRGSFEVRAPALCLGQNGASFTVGQVESFACPSGQSGSKNRTCQAGGVWSVISDSCTAIPSTCQGYLGGTYSAGQEERLSCPTGQTGYQSHICQNNGWSSTINYCQTPSPSISNAAKTGSLSKRFACSSGATSCVQAGITLTGLNLSNFDYVTVSWNGRVSGSQNIYASSGQVVSKTATSIELWPTVFDASDPVGTCYTWTFKVVKGSASTSTLSLSTGQVCRPSGV
jgi:surface antigen